MAHDPIAARYAQAIFETAKADGQLEETLEQLSVIGGLLHDHPDLRRLMGNPDVDPKDKVGILERSLNNSWSALVRAAVQMVVSMGRADLIQEIVEALQAMVDTDQGRLRVVVRSAHPLPEAILQRLRAKLEAREHQHVELHAETAPELIGGLQVVLGHRVIDGSIRRQLSNLRERLTTVKVY